MKEPSTTPKLNYPKTISKTICVDDVKYLNIPMSQLLDIWLNTKRVRVKISTYAHYSRVIEKILKPYFKEKTTA